MINTTTTLKGLNGEVLMASETEEQTIGGVLSTILTREQSTDPVRAFQLAQSYYNGEEVKKSDLGFVKTAVKASKLFIPLVTGQVLEILENAK